MRNVLVRLYHTKLLLSSVILLAAGIVLLIVDNQLVSGDAPRWQAVIPWNELGGILFGAGLLSIWLDYFLRREQDAIDELRLRRLLHEHAPAMRDAVLQAFAANHEDLERVATPDMLDQIISNSLALRLNDAQFAREIYTDIRDQAISASERWYDASLSITLSPIPAKADTSDGKALAALADSHFAVTVRWEYTTIPKHAQRRFVCVSDREEYAELVHERDSTSAWYMRPAGVDASSRQGFELLRFAVDGEDWPIRRMARKHAQTYTASLDPQHVRAGQPVTITYTYRTVTAKHGHMLFFDIEQPTRDLKIDFNYADCGIASISTLDLVPSMRPTRIERPPGPAPADVVRVDLDGWIFPRSGVAFVWTLEREMRPASPSLDLSG